jgi:hypothetical protein
MAWTTLTYKITGDAPLIMHNGDLANPLSKAAKALKQVTSKKKKTDADFERMAEIEFKAGLYIDEDRGPVIPGENIEATLYNAAKITKEGKIAKSACFVPKAAVLQYDGPRDADGLWQDERFRNCVGVKVGMSRIMRTRPIFHSWSAIVEVEFEDSVVNEEHVDRWVHAAGTQVGLCDWRPRCGRFTAEKVAATTPKNRKTAPEAVGAA